MSTQKRNSARTEFPCTGCGALWAPATAVCELPTHPGMGVQIRLCDPCYDITFTAKQGQSAILEAIAKKARFALGNFAGLLFLGDDK